MIRSRCASVGLASLVLLFTAICGAEPPQDGNANGMPVFKTGTRVVLVDIVATDSSGKPIHALKAQDFQIFDDGKRQTIRSFDEHTPDESGVVSLKKQPVLGPGVYSNWVPPPRVTQLASSFLTRSIWSGRTRPTHEKKWFSI